ncbi:MAG: ATP-binding protein [Myxococcaceae bacterium]
MSSLPRLRLATRLGITHGALVLLLIALLVVTLQGLIRMLNVMTLISDQKLTALDAEEELHRAAWAIEVALRHGRVACSTGVPEADVQTRITAAAESFASVAQKRAQVAAPKLRETALKYGTFAAEALSAPTCAFLALTQTEEKRTKLDEEMTDAWIERLHELHSDIELKEQTARSIGSHTAVSGVIFAVLAAITAAVVARTTAQSITRPVARLAADATRLGEGDFAPIAPVDGPQEIEDLRRDLERTREKLLEVDRLKHAFLANVSHELRSPLGRLREALALLSDGTVGTLTPQQTRVLMLARRACEHEVRIVEALLDMSRVSSGLPIQREENVALEPVIEAAIKGEQDAATERSVELVFIKNAVPPLKLDSALIERTVANLVRNAISVSPRGGLVKVILSMPGRVRVDVIDNGPGLSPEVVGRIFEPFAAAGVAKAGRPAGIGLGLSLSRGITRAHGGDLTVLREDASTIFRMELPEP